MLNIGMNCYVKQLIYLDHLCTAISRNISLWTTKFVEETKDYDKMLKYVCTILTFKKYQFYSLHYVGLIL